MQHGLIEHAGRAEGGQFAVAVACHRFRGDAERFKDLQRSQADRADGRLGGFGRPQLLFLALTSFRIKGGGRVDQVGQQLAIDLAVACIGGGQGLQRLGETAGQVPEHAGVLCSLAREEHAQGTVLRSAGITGAVGCVPAGQRIFLQHITGVGNQRGQLGLVTLHNQRQPAVCTAVERGPRSCRRTPQLVPGSLEWYCCQGGIQSGGIGAGKGENLDVAVPLRCILFGAVFLQHQVEVGAAETEGADAGPARRVAVGQPGALFSCQVERGAAGGYLVQRLLQLDRRRQHLVVQGQRSLDHPRRSGGGLGVSDLGFYRSQ